MVNEERAIVSDIAGTTRDSIEDEISINGIGFRFIDTAGIRVTEDKIESLGIKKTYEKIKQSQLILRLIDTPKLFVDDQIDEDLVKSIQREINQLANQFPDQPLLVVTNKMDVLTTDQHKKIDKLFPEALSIAASTKKALMN